MMEHNSVVVKEKQAKERRGGEEGEEERGRREMEDRQGNRHTDNASSSLV